MARAYDQMAPYLVPNYDWLQDELLRLLPLDGLKPVTIVDLGGGSGRLIEKILRRAPQATCIYVDYSQDFLDVARERLVAFTDRVQFVTASFEDAWESHLPAAPDAIVSMSAIHHLDTQGKKNLYGRCLATLQPAGWFFNVDEMKTISHAAYLNSLHFWLRWVEDARDAIPEQYRQTYDQWKQHFDKWKIRNVDNADQPKVKGDDIHEGFIEQAQWLTEAGFTNVDVFFKYHVWAAIGGQKPA